MNKLCINITFVLALSAQAQASNYSFFVDCKQTSSIKETELNKYIRVMSANERLATEASFKITSTGENLSIEGYHLGQLKAWLDSWQPNEYGQMEPVIKSSFYARRSTFNPLSFEFINQKIASVRAVPDYSSEMEYAFNFRKKSLVIQGTKFSAKFNCVYTHGFSEFFTEY